MTTIAIVMNYNCITAQCKMIHYHSTHERVVFGFRGCLSSLLLAADVTEDASTDFTTLHQEM